MKRTVANEAQWIAGFIIFHKVKLSVTFVSVWFLYRKAHETTQYRALATKEHMLPLGIASRDSNLSMGRTSGLNSLPRNSLAQNQLYDNFITDIKEEASSNPESPDLTIDANEEDEEGSRLNEPANFRHLQTELRARKRLQSSLSYSFMSPALAEEEIVSARKPPRGKSHALQDNLTGIAGNRRRSQYTAAARTSFLSGRHLDLYIIEIWNRRFYILQPHILSVNTGASG